MWRHLSLYLPIRHRLFCAGRSTRELYNYHSLAFAMAAHLTKDCVNTSKRHWLPSPIGHPMHNTRLLWSSRPDSLVRRLSGKPHSEATRATPYTANPIDPKTNQATSNFREALGTPKTRLSMIVATQPICLVQSINLLASKTQRMAVSTSDPSGFNWANGHFRSLKGWEDYALPMAHRRGTLSSPTSTITWRSWRNQRLEHRS